MQRRLWLDCGVLVPSPFSFPAQRARATRRASTGFFEDSAVGMLDHGDVSIVPNAEGALTTPSVVGLVPGGKPLVGIAAKRQAISNPGIHCLPRSSSSSRTASSGCGVQACLASRPANPSSPSVSGRARRFCNSSASAPRSSRSAPPSAAPSKVISGVGDGVVSSGSLPCQSRPRDRTSRAGRTFGDASGSQGVAHRTVISGRENRAVLAQRSGNHDREAAPPVTRVCHFSHARGEPCPSSSWPTCAQNADRELGELWRHRDSDHARWTGRPSGKFQSYGHPYPRRAAISIMTPRGPLRASRS